MDLSDVVAGTDCFGDRLDPGTTLYVPDDSHGWFYGTPGDDVIIGTSGNEWIDCGGGNDTICGYQGGDQVVGGDGVDHIATSADGRTAPPARYVGERQSSVTMTGWGPAGVPSPAASLGSDCPCRAGEFQRPWDPP